MFSKINLFDPDSFVFHCTSKSREEIQARIMNLTDADVISLIDYLKIHISRSINKINETESWFYETYKYSSLEEAKEGLNNYFNCEYGMHISLRELLKNTRHRDIIPSEDQPIRGFAYMAMEMAKIYTSFRMTLEICEKIFSITISMQEEARDSLKNLHSLSNTK